MKKKLILASSVLLGLVVVILTLCFTVFTVKTIDVDFRTSTSQGYDNEQIIQESGIQYGKCLLFMSKGKSIKKLEENYPYLEVINIETIFPSKIVIHCAERKPLFAIQEGESVIICDDDFKVLEKREEVYVSSSNNEILLKNLEFDNREIQKGSFLNIKQKEIKSFLSSMMENSLGINQVLGFCKEVELEEEFNYLTNKNEVHITLTTFTERKIKILNIASNLNYKFQRMFQALPMLYELLVTNGDYTSEEVDRCSLVIGNQITNERELYVHIYLDGEIISSKDKGE